MKHLTAAHITHEACEKIGGIGTVLEGLFTSPVYQQHVKRNILVGPYYNRGEEPSQRLGETGRVLYSTMDKIDETGQSQLGARFHPVEWAFNAPLIYGTREFVQPGSDDHTGTVEILLIDVFNVNQQRLNHLKWRMAEMFKLDSRRYESDWSYDEYVRLAEPAFYALLALLGRDELPCLLFSHEFMGLPTAFKAILDGQQQFRTVFYAHECGTARRIVEGIPGHDVAFYNVLKEASRHQGIEASRHQESRLDASMPHAPMPGSRYVEDIFGDQSSHFRHALVSRAHLCDAIIAVGDYTARELHFLGDHFDHHHIDLVYNGIPPLKITINAEQRSREMLLEYSQTLLGFVPDVLMTHVMRPVISKGLWRDAQVCDELERHFAQTNQRGALFILTSGGGTRRPQDVRSMEAEYGWPRHHREGYPDLVGPEVEFNRMVEEFNARHERIQMVLVNQFGWSRDLIGTRLPAQMNFGDFRRATDIEFGMATYEPFGISPLEPLGSGAICVISNVCGCASFALEAAALGGGEPTPNVIIADYTELDRAWSIPELVNMTQADRDVVELRVARQIAAQLIAHVPSSAADRKALLESGQELMKRMNWDWVVEHKMLPMLRRVMDQQGEPQRARQRVFTGAIAAG